MTAMDHSHFALFLVLASFSGKAASMCPRECSCRNEPVRCLEGIKPVKDGCNCCDVCPRQQGEPCDTVNACDPHKSLVCIFTTDETDHGICNAQIGQSCSYNGRTYLNTEMFQPTCKHQCWCMDGTVGCLLLCPHETRVPRQTDCPNARLEFRDGDCCEKWLCGSGDKVFELPLENFWEKYVDQNSDSDFVPATLPEEEVPPESSTSLFYPRSTMPNWDETDLNRPSYVPRLRPIMADPEISDDGGDGDELIDYQMASVLMQKGGAGLKDWFGDDFSEGDDFYEYENWGLSNEVVGDDDVITANRQVSQWKEYCSVQTTSWSPCSKSCGMAVATRVTNNNPECQLMRQSRLCNIRPCDDPQYVIPKRGKRCIRHKREHRRTYFKYAGCKSVRAYKPRYCGGCDDGRCCTPQSTRTVRVRFRCENGMNFVKSMLMIRSCKCHNQCAMNSVNGFLVSRDLTNDMHKLSQA